MAVRIATLCCSFTVAQVSSLVCLGIDYIDLDYGSSLHFATTASNNGHDGREADGRPFLNNLEVVNDFAYRAIHVESVIGKQITEAYYEKPHRKSYYLGCSTGGRQAMQAALKFPEDFDGLVAGAPAINFQHLLGAEIMWGSFVGALNPGNSPSESFIPPELWEVVSLEILKQCDGLDGIEDGIVTDPEQCNFRPEALLCDTEKPERSMSPCATPKQLEALRKIYQPLYGTQGQFLYPRFDPSAEADGQFAPVFGGDLFPIPMASEI